MLPTSKKTLLSRVTTVLTGLILLASVLLSGSSYETKTALPAAADLGSFSAMAPIDAHVHLYKDDPDFGAFLKRLNLRVLDIIVIDDRDPFGKGSRSSITMMSRTRRFRRLRKAPKSGSSL